MEEVKRPLVKRILGVLQVAKSRTIRTWRELVRSNHVSTNCRHTPFAQESRAKQLESRLIRSCETVGVVNTPTSRYDTIRFTWLAIPIILRDSDSAIINIL